MTKFIVAVYLEDRAFGGSEEGGWYYDCGELVRVSHVFGNEDRAIAFCRRMNDRLRATLNRGRREISSVLSEGRYAARIEEDFAPQYFPQQRPYYE